MKILVIGANSTLAENWLRIRLANQDGEVTLFGRDEMKIAELATDLAIRFPKSTFHARAFDFSPVELTKEIQAIPVPDIAVIAVGSMVEQSELAANPALISHNIYVNAAIPIITAEALIPRMRPTGKLAIFGSVAGDRGRAKNYIYGAGKAYLATAAAGLAQRLYKSGPKIILIKPGPTATNMTRELVAAGQKMADPTKVAKIIDQGIEKGSPVIYAPGIWRVVMLVIMHLPRAIFNRMRF